MLQNLAVENEAIFDTYLDNFLWLFAWSSLKFSVQR